MYGLLSGLSLNDIELFCHKFSDWSGIGIEMDEAFDWFNKMKEGRT